jgi:putative membrane protein
LIAFLAFWSALAVSPRYRDDWILENLPTMVAVPVVVFAHRRFRFSDRAYVQGTVFLALHTIGSHYTYSEVPLGDWVRDALAQTRNHYDRLVHLAFGVLLYRPVQELAFHRSARVGAFARRYLTFTAVASWSLLYEVLEWLVAVRVDPAAGTAFLGTQGDGWDAPKDMALACLGALVAACEPGQTRWRRRPAPGRNAAPAADDPEHAGRAPTRPRRAPGARPRRAARPS